MTLKLYFHPLASFCHKALIALYENRIPFAPIIVDLHDEASSAAFRPDYSPVSLCLAPFDCASHAGKA